MLLLLLALPLQAAEVAGVKFDGKAKVGNAELALAGAGLRKRLFFQVYAIGLYVQDPKADPIAQAGPKRVRIHMLRDVGAQQFTEALADGIQANHGEAQAKALEPRVAQLGAIMARVGEAKTGMAITLDWNGKETLVSIDGKPAGDPIPGEDFYRALLRIWLGEQPVQEDLKKALRGG
ncbi:MAG TPA: chalcone isomerase family protein [Burkholderiales bacterium]|nr:chalcone isomerase family protein [Burkholderiales bacterium]